MKKKKTAYIVPHTHWDREWRYPIWKNRQLLVEFMDELLDTLEKNKTYRYFHLDGQTVIIEDYLEIRPEKEDAVREFVTQGRLGIGPFYTLPDLYPISGECIVRNLQKGMQTALKYGGHVKVGYHSFGWGQISQFPQIYNNLGFDFLIAAKHVSKKRAPEIEFLWESPDGSRIITSRLGQHSRANFYFNGYIQLKHDVDYAGKDFRYIPGKNKGAIHNTDPLKQNQDYFCYSDADAELYEKHIEIAMEKAWEAYKDTCVPEKRLILDGSDFSSCQPLLPEIIKKTNGKVHDIEVKHSSLEEYVESVIGELKDKELKVVRGELRDGSPADCTGNALTTRMYLKILNRKVQNTIIGKAEPLSAFMSLLGMEYPQSFLDKAWDFMFKSHAHDSINGVTQDKTANDVEFHLNQALEIGETIIDKSMGFLANKICTNKDKEIQHLLLFNPLPFSREEVLRLIIDTPRETNTWNIMLEDKSGNSLPVQHISRMERTSPVYDMDSRSWPYYHDRHEVIIQTGVIPPCGYKVLQIKSKGNFDRQAEWWPIMETTSGNEISQAPGILENEYLKLRADSATGTIDILNKETGKEFKGLHYFVDEGDTGDYWVYYPHYQNQLIDSRMASHRSWISENGSLSATLVIETTMEVPSHGNSAKKGIEGESKRSEEKVKLCIKSSFTLLKDAKSVDVVTTIDNIASDHRLRLFFPTGIDAEYASADGHFSVEQRPVEPLKNNDGEFYSGMQTLPMGRFVNFDNGKEGLAVLTNSIGEYEMLRDDNHTLALTLFRSVENRICTEYRASGYFPEQKGGQSLRKMSFEYAIMPHKGDWEEASILKHSEMFNLSPIAYQLTSGGEGKIQQTKSMMEISSSRISVSAIKQAENMEGLIVRLYNPGKEDDTISLKTDLNVSSAYICTINEEFREKIEVVDNKLIINIMKGEIKTVFINISN